MNLKETRIEEVIEAVAYHSNLYYNKSEPEITDFEFDALRDELKELVEEMEQIDPTNAYVLAGKEALNNVGASASYGKKVTHQATMGSLEKATTINEVKSWYTKYAPPEGCLIAVEYKYDGCAGRINFENQDMVQAATRGDGSVGQDVTDNVREIKSISKTIRPKGKFELRGEIMMFRDVFKQMVARGEKMKNPRNAGTGSLMAQDPKVTGSRNLNFVCYDVFGAPTFQTEESKWVWMKHSLPEFRIADMKIMTIEDFEKYAEEMSILRPSLDFEIDGLVISLNSIQAQEDAGWNGNRPRGKIAFKFKPEQKSAVVLGIDRQVGRTGKLTPMARIEPTLLAGTTISNITLHNDSRLADLGINIGDEVLIEKAGDIIPEVVRVSKKNTTETCAHAIVCPSCGQPVEWDERMVAQWCRNSLCPAQVQRTILHWVKTLDIKGLGTGIVNGLCDAGLVKEFADLYYLTEEQIQTVTGGSGSAKKVLNAILEKGEMPLDVFLDGLGIDGLGTSNSKVLAKEFRTLIAIRSLSGANLNYLSGFGTGTSKKIVEGLQKNSGVIERLLEVVNVFDVEDNNGPLSGMSFVLTGAMSLPRKSIEQMIEKAGGENKGSVSKGVTYLVQADASSTSSKTEKAHKVGTKVISEEELMKMMGN